MRIDLSLHPRSSAPLAFDKVVVTLRYCSDGINIHWVLPQECYLNSFNLNKNVISSFLYVFSILSVGSPLHKIHVVEFEIFRAKFEGVESVKVLKMLKVLKL